MDRHVSPVLLAAYVAKEEGASTSPASYEITTAERAGFKEAWLQNAIANDPELIIGACREAALSAGFIDVLLVSESGRVSGPFRGREEANEKP